MFATADTPSGQPTILAKNAMVSAGHYLATGAGFSILARGGNAVDAGVAAGLCLNVVHCDFNCFSGVAPIIVYLADRSEVVSLAGIGWWPEAVSREMFAGTKADLISEWPLQSVVPAAPDSWLTALRDYGTLTFAEVAAPALHLAETGFPVARFMRITIEHYIENFRRWSPNRELFLVDGAPPPVGRVIRLPGLARTFRQLIDVEESAAGRGRETALTEVRNAFYRGEIARDLVAMNQAAGGLLSENDFADYQVKSEPVCHLNYRGFDVYTCGPWCQGPVLLQALNVLKEFELASMGHNSPEYVHHVAESLKLAFADREGFYGDPAFVEVPLDILLSDDYGEQRASLIDPDEAWPAMPPCGDVSSGFGWRPIHSHLSASTSELSDTSFVTVIDRQGNIFSATPSDGYCNAPVHPKWGLHISERGQQTFLDPTHPNHLAPRKRPRLTPSPALVLKDGQPFMGFGTPGNDRQPQAMLQFLLGMLEFDMPPQTAVTQPRFASFSFPASAHPHPYLPGVLRVEDNLAADTIATLEDRGHRIERWPARHWMAGGVCAVVRDPQTGTLWGAADPRREGCALGM